MLGAIWLLNSCGCTLTTRVSLEQLDVVVPDMHTCLVQASTIHQPEQLHRPVRCWIESIFLSFFRITVLLLAIMILVLSGETLP